MAKKNTLILFDCFGVLYGRIVKAFFENYYGDPEAERLTRLFTLEKDLGKGRFADIAKMIEKDLGFDEKKVIEEWKTLIKRNDELFDYIESLKDKCHLAMLSNCARGQIQFVVGKSRPLRDYFEHIVLSCNKGMVKPNPRIYLDAVSHFKTNFEKVIMVDDSLNNLENLSSIGIIGVHFTTNEQLKTDLAELGIE